MLVVAGLTAYRSTDPAWANIKLGGGSFSEAPGAHNYLPHLLDALDAANVPVDFVSMHSYRDAPQAIVADEVSTTRELFDARHNGRYAHTERVLAEWGVDLSHLLDGAFNRSMQAPL